MTDGTADGWNSALPELIAATPDEAILHNQIMFVPELPRFAAGRVVLLGDAAHGLSPHIAAGGTLGIEDVGVLARALAAASTSGIPLALKAFEADRLPRYAQVRAHSREVAEARDAAQYARSYAAFSYWMRTEAPRG
jgi:salicylate hydroxylase